MPLLRSHQKESIRIRLVEHEDGDITHVSLYLPNTVVTAQFLEGRFPDYRTVVPRSANAKAILYAADMKVALQRAKIFAKHNPNTCYVDIKPASWLLAWRTLSASWSEKLTSGATIWRTAWSATLISRSRTRKG